MNTQIDMTVTVAGNEDTISVEGATDPGCSVPLSDFKKAARRTFEKALHKYIRENWG